MLSANLPEDLMMQIIVRLPVKSLLRFKCVAKSWYALITDRSFITRHLEFSNSISKNRCLKLMFQTHNANEPHSISLISNREEPYVVQDLELPFPRNNLKWIFVYCQCNGIFSLCGIYEEDIREVILWNPATKEVKAIPASQCQPKGIYRANYGFGYDPITKDYKIVRFPIFPLGKELPLVEVYNVSTNSWRKIDVDVPIFESYYSHNGSYLNGAYHWLSRDLDKVNEFIVSFDFRKEVFGIIQSPPRIASSSTINNLLVVDDKLVWAITYGSIDYRVQIWVMNEYGIEKSWTKKFEIGPFLSFGRILGFWGDDEILVDQRIGQLISYNLRNQQKQKFQIYFKIATVIDYVESLFPLGGKGKHKNI